MSIIGQIKSIREKKKHSRLEGKNNVPSPTSDPVLSKVSTFSTPQSCGLVGCVCVSNLRWRRLCAAVR